MKEGRKPEYPKKTPGDEFQKMPHTTARRFKPQARLEPAQQHWWQARKADMLTVTPHVEGGRNSSVGSAWARCPQRRGFDPPLGTFSGRGDFSLGVNMGSNSIPPKTLSDGSINRGVVCAHMHFIARTQKILTFMS